MSNKSREQPINSPASIYPIITQIFVFTTDESLLEFGRKEIMKVTVTM
jgi:hypothetical protein